MNDKNKDIGAVLSAIVDENGKRLVVYFGRCYYIPDYYAFIATDEDEKVYAYESRPCYCPDSDMWFGGCGMLLDERDDLQPSTSLLEIPG